MEKSARVGRNKLRRLRRRSTLNPHTLYDLTQESYLSYEKIGAVSLE